VSDVDNLKSDRMIATDVCIISRYCQNCVIYLNANPNPNPNSKPKPKPNITLTVVLTAEAYQDE